MGSEARWGRSGGGDCFLGLHEAERVGAGDQARAMRREALVEASWTSGAELVLTGWARAMRGQMMMGSATGKRSSETIRRWDIEDGQVTAARERQASERTKQGVEW